MSFHAGQSFTFGETPSATKWNYLWENDYALQDWTAFTNATFPIALIDDGDVTGAKLDADAIGHGFLEIGRTTLGSAGDTISVQNLPAFKYLRIYCFLIQVTNAIDSLLRFNNDSGNNYAYRISTNGGADGTATSQNFVPGQTSATANQFLIFDVINVAAQAKSVIGQVLNDGASGAGTAPVRREVTSKWHNTSAQISRVDCINSAAGDFNTGSEVIVFGKN